MSCQSNRFRNGVGVVVAWLSCLAISAIAPGSLAAEPAAARPTNWPVFRGDTAGAGVATSALPTELEVLWKFTAEDSLFLSTAVIVDGVVFVGDADRTFYAIDLATGKQLWSFPSEIGFTAAAAVRDGRVFVGDSDGVFYCADARTGKPIWKHETAAEINSSANFFQDSVLVGSQDGTLYRFRAEDGKVLWKYTIEASGGIQCSPTLAGNRAFVCGCDGQLHVIDVEKGNSVATLEIGDPTLATPAIAGDRVYFGTEGSRFLAVDWRMPRVSWSYEHEQRKLSYRASAAVNDQVVVVGGRNKLIEALHPKTGKVLWSFPTRGRIDSSPVIVRDRVYVGSLDGRLYAIDLQTGKEVWNYDAGTGFSASPAVADGRLVIGNEDGVLYCFGKKNKPE